MSYNVEYLSTLVSQTNEIKVRKNNVSLSQMLGLIMESDHKRFLQKFDFTKHKNPQG